MDSKQLMELVDHLDDNLETLEEALKPILEDSLHSVSKKLPLLDRAKLNITVVYAIESLLFSYLRVNGVNARDHPVFKELERVKHYFGKVKEIEEKSIVTKPSITLNKQAAARIIQSSLANNGASDPAQRERELKERLIAMRKLKAAQANMENNSKPTVEVTTASIAPSATTPAITAQPSPNNPSEEDQSSAEEGEIEEDDESNVQMTDTVSQPAPNQNVQHGKKRKQGQDGHPNNKQGQDNHNNNEIGRKASKKAKKKKKKNAKNTI